MKLAVVIFFVVNVFIEDHIGFWVLRVLGEFRLLEYVFQWKQVFLSCISNGVSKWFYSRSERIHLPSLIRRRGLKQLPCWFVQCHEHATFQACFGTEIIKVNLEDFCAFDVRELDDWAHWLVKRVGRALWLIFALTWANNQDSILLEIKHACDVNLLPHCFVLFALCVQLLKEPFELALLK